MPGLNVEGLGVKPEEERGCTGRERAWVKAESG